MEIKKGSNVICRAYGIGLVVGQTYIVQRMGCCSLGHTVYIDGMQYLTDWFEPEPETD